MVQRFQEALTKLTNVPIMKNWPSSLIPSFPPFLLPSYLFFPFPTFLNCQITLMSLWFILWTLPMGGNESLQSFWNCGSFVIWWRTNRGNRREWAHCWCWLHHQWKVTSTEFINQSCFTQSIFCWPQAMCQPGIKDYAANVANLQWKWENMKGHLFI